ncbi:MAG: nucleotidyltransferase domain-containing protein [Candidatus Korarchaeum sp.]
MDRLREMEDALVILFGSRARGDNTPLSDYDLLVISDERPPEAPCYVQLFWYRWEDVENEVRLFNTILVDAIIEGKVLRDGKGTYELLRRKIEAEIESRGLVRTELGWVIEIFSWRRSTARSRGPQ